jgi:hypothetical protein
VGGRGGRVGRKRHASLLPHDRQLRLGTRQRQADARFGCGTKWALRQRTQDRVDIVGAESLHVRLADHRGARLEQRDRSGAVATDFGEQAVVVAG